MASVILFFFYEFAEYVGYLVTSPGFVLLTGDFNLHVDSSEDFISQRFLDLVTSYNWFKMCLQQLMHVVTPLTS